MGEIPPPILVTLWLDRSARGYIKDFGGNCRIKQDKCSENRTYVCYNESKGLSGLSIWR